MVRIIMRPLSKKITVSFYRTASGKEPPIGMPVCRPLSGGLYEVRSTLTGSRIARIIFCIYDSRMILLHRFIKKTQ